MKTCATCGESYGDKQFSKEGTVCFGCRFGSNDNASTERAEAILVEYGFDPAATPNEITAMEPELAKAYATYLASAESAATVKLTRVPILSEGGPYYGTGSPPEGDYYTRADLELIAEANRELADEVKAANKIGHSKEQKLLANSGLALDETPAAGWLPGKSFTVEQADDGKWKLYSDIVRVPSKLSKLFELGAFRTRSVELSKVTSGDKVYAAVVTGLAWLGAKAPAVRTLDDIYALYHADDQAEAGRVVELLYADATDLPTEVVRVIDYAADDPAATIVWQPETGFQDLLGDLQAALNPQPDGSYDSDTRYWVSDVSVDLDRCIVNDWKGNATWIVPFTMGDDGDPVPADASEWTLAEQAWVKASNDLAEKNFAEALKTRERRADTTVEMPEAIRKLTDMSDEQIVTLATTFGLEGEDAAVLRPQLEEHIKSLSAEPEVAPVVKPTPTVEPTAEMAELTRRAELGERAYEERRVEKREALIEYALGMNGEPARILPAQADEWRKFYDANPELASAQVKLLSPITQERVYGSDENLPSGVTDEQAAQTGEAAWAEYAAATGVPMMVTSNG